MGADSKKKKNPFLLAERLTWSCSALFLFITKLLEFGCYSQIKRYEKKKH